MALKLDLYPPSDSDSASGQSKVSDDAAESLFVTVPTLIGCASESHVSPIHRENGSSYSRDEKTATRASESWKLN